MRKMKLRLAVAVAGWLAGQPAMVLAGAFKPYPGAQIDERTTEIANLRATATPGGPARKTTVYVTSHSYDKVVAYYRNLGREAALPAAPGKPAKPAKPEDGKPLRQTYIMLDNAPALRLSKRWVKVQSPYGGSLWAEAAKPADPPEQELTGILYVETE
jgi:hypothetical protein